MDNDFKIKCIDEKSIHLYSHTSVDVSQAFRLALGHSKDILQAYMDYNSLSISDIDNKLIELSLADMKIIYDIGFESSICNVYLTYKLFKK